MICVSGTSLVVSFPLALLARYIGRTLVVVSACLLQFCILIALLIITADHESFPGLFIMGGAWGAADTVIQTQVAGMSLQHIDDNNSLSII